jgi:uncharacterized membrane protein YeaQ/YmgE (transglycosylase-associated protein family)
MSRLACERLPECKSLVHRKPDSMAFAVNIKLRRTVMSFLAWIVLGLLAGFIGSKMVNKQGEGMFLDIILGVVGAVVGGWVFTLFGASGVTGLNLYSIFVAVVGSVIFLVIYHALFRRA